MADGLLRGPQLSQTDPPAIAMGGDVSGTTAAAVVAAIRGYAVQDHAPENAEVLTWVASSNRWEPQPGGSALPSGSAQNQLLVWNGAAWSASQTIAADSSVEALKIMQNGSGEILRLWAGTIAGGTNRLSVTKLGLITANPSDDIQCMDLNPAVTNVAGEYAGLDLTVAHSVDLTQDGKDVFGLKVAVPSRAGDSSVSDVEHAAFRAHFAGGTIPTGGKVWPVGFSAASGLMVGFRSKSPVLFDVDPPASLSAVQANLYTGAAPSTVQLLYLAAGATILSATPVLAVRADGKTTHSVAAALGSAYKLQDITNSKTRVEFESQGVFSFLGAQDTSFNPAFRLTNDWATNEDAIIFEVVSNKSAASVETIRSFNSGMTEFKTHSDTPSTAVPVISLIQTDQSEGFANFSGAENADQVHSISTSSGDGSTVVGPYSKTTSIGWMFYKMVQVRINGLPCWICTYAPAD